VFLLVLVHLGSPLQRAVKPLLLLLWPVLSKVMQLALFCRLFFPSRLTAFVEQDIKVKVKVRFLYSTAYMVAQEHCTLTISEMAVDWQEPVVLRHKCGHPLPALTDIGQ